MSAEKVNPYIVTMVFFKPTSGKFEAMPKIFPADGKVELCDALVFRTFGKDVVIQVVSECIFAPSQEIAETISISHARKEYPQLEGWCWHFARIVNVESLMIAVVKQITDEYKDEYIAECIAKRFKLGESSKEEFEM